MKSPNTYPFLVPVSVALALFAYITVLAISLPSPVDAEEPVSEHSSDDKDLERSPTHFSDFGKSREGFISLGPQTGRKKSPEKKFDPAYLPEIKVLVASWCPYCVRLERFLKKNKIKYTRLDIERSVQAARLYEVLGQGGVPITRVGSTVIRGYDPEAILRAIQKYEQQNRPKGAAEL